MNKIILIPSRLQSERLPEKPLKLIGSKTMIEMVYDAASKSVADKVTIATDSQSIFKEVKNFGGNVEMTNPNHSNGTERIFEAAEKMGLAGEDIVINLQGDEPFSDPNDINNIFELLQEKNIEMVSMFTELKDKSDLKNPNVVKVSVVDSVAQDFYRKETNIDKKAYIHLGVYGFKFRTLKKLINLPKSENEIALKLEQMRAMDNNILIHMIKSVAKIHLGVDTNEDLELANKLIGND